jgi:hypothetical protein
MGDMGCPSSTLRCEKRGEVILELYSLFNDWPLSFETDDSHIFYYCWFIYFLSDALSSFPTN